MRAPLDYPTEEGVVLARERGSAFTHATVVLVFTVAVFVLGMAFGQLIQQLNHDARAWEMDRRV